DERHPDDARARPAVAAAFGADDAARELPAPLALTRRPRPLSEARRGGRATGALLRAVPPAAGRAGTGAARREHAAPAPQPGQVPGAQDARPVRLQPAAPAQPAARPGAGPGALH